MLKNFDKWNENKKELEKALTQKYAYPREIWWCSLGVNLGAEIDGKNESFERPVIVMKVYNKETMVILPLTTKPKDDRFHHKIQSEDKTTWVKLTQMRVISNKRLSRKVGVLNEAMFDELKKVWIKSL
ncbi:MAG: type II toxin-antitoxin system PemK/MazF family toxin [Candidatus Taylorbacteria bacterium]|nr:type II toxin-antitoxin system PemK/MazF family toxin [Candidatus Taylorbacteria bacterium]